MRPARVLAGSKVMPNFDRTPERFDPATLNRTVIATPLLEKMDKERPLTKMVREEYPEQARKYNSVILVPEDLGTSEAVRAALQHLVDETLENAGERLQALRGKHRVGERLPGKNGFFAW